MHSNSFLNISQLSKELGSGEAIIKFVIKRFKKWIGTIDDTGQLGYNQSNLITIITILEKITNGTLPSLIEEELENGIIMVANSNVNKQPQQDKNFQKRIAIALEKRNEIEKTKTEALNNIAKEISKLKTFPQQDLVSEKNTDKLDIDDLSQLLPKNKIIVEPHIDDLSSLIETNSEIKHETADTHIIDNLATLIDHPSDDLPETDDLSLLLKENDQDNGLIDDLSLLIDLPTSEAQEIDDLSALIDFEPKDNPEIPKPKASPKDDFENYKSEIINIIIDLKNSGLTEEDTCKRFNEEGILTFSGKTNWSVKTISQIYQLINNAA